MWVLLILFVLCFVFLHPSLSRILPQPLLKYRTKVKLWILMKMAAIVGRNINFSFDIQPTINIQGKKYTFLNVVKITYESNVLWIPYKRGGIRKRVNVVFPDGSRLDISHQPGIPCFVTAKMFGGTHIEVSSGFGETTIFDPNQVPIL